MKANKLTRVKEFHRLSAADRAARLKRVQARLKELLPPDQFSGEGGQEKLERMALGMPNLVA
jgi:hypothetical protein